ncbi:pentapeptide repeat-containing protein [Mucilaginibacter psychrotolerans]|uniref:Pentapeptide repeat-containing protein n=1 Tax=Mucilaginibacter psychrotolerans TaxID=1524096 RepID=A0A4Y8SM47_9SPHI|nr:pentapeptide repeat-containing protein [Mucilaginibacter psychrotolerans]TFF39544.1 pentapeptide repeat-containing protein [Mucilaginibacter psychrotolerans]
MQTLDIINDAKKLNVEEANLSGSTIRMACLNNLMMEDVSATGVKITNANLSDLEIEGAQLGGAFIHNIGMPPKDHPYYDPTAKQRPLRFEDSDLNGSTISNCDLSNVAISDCETRGMTINGILVNDLLAAYRGGK